MSRKTVAISGSFRKYYKEILNTIKEFKLYNIDVLSPKESEIINPNDEFVFLKSDEIKDPKILELNHLNAIKLADALYVCNPNGYIGCSATLEIGYALSLGKPIYLKEKPTDIIIEVFATKIASPKEVAEVLNNNNFERITTDSLNILQHYVYKSAIERGFDDEKPLEIMVLLMEEIGELTKEIRKYEGLKVDIDKEQKLKLSKELADVFIYILHLANACNINLFESFKEKEKENIKRKWGIQSHSKN